MKKINVTDSLVKDITKFLADVEVEFNRYFNLTLAKSTETSFYVVAINLESIKNILFKSKLNVTKNTKLEIKGQFYKVNKAFSKLKSSNSLANINNHTSNDFNKIKDDVSNLKYA